MSGGAQTAAKMSAAGGGGGFFAEFQERIVARDPNTIGILVAALVGLLTLLLALLWTRRRIFGRAVLLCGPCDAGKTTLFAQLLHGKPMETYTSMKENTGELVIQGKKSLQLVDIPGHGRIREAILDRYADGARGLVYVVDSATISKQIRDVAEFLFNLLTSDRIHAIRPALLILCNKQDVGTAKGAALIQSMLEKELNACRLSHAIQLEGTSGEGSGRVQLGVEGRDFTFSDLSMKVSVMESSAQNLDTLEPLRSWLTALA